MTDVLAPPAEQTAASTADETTMSRGERWITAFIVGTPVLALAFGIVWFWGEGVHLRDVLIGTAMFLVAGHGITIGFHRLLAHKSFASCRPLKLGLAIAGSLAFEGGPIGWVADHRRHHVFSDQPEDPHSPHRFGSGIAAQLRGLCHAHVGWLFGHTHTSWTRHAADLLADRDLVVINALFPLWCVVSLALPFGLGWLLGGGVGAALERAAVGRRRQDPAPAPRDLEHQLAVPHLRTATVPDQRPQREPRRAVVGLDG